MEVQLVKWTGLWKKAHPAFWVSPPQDWDLHSGHLVCPGNGFGLSVASMISLLNVGNKIFVLILACYAAN